MTLDVQNNVYTFTMPEGEVTLVVSEWQEPAKIDPELSFSQDATVDLLEEFSAADYLINQYNVPVTYTSSNTNVATVDNTGALTIIDVGSIAITASFAGDSTYEADSATMYITVQDSSTQDFRFTSIYPQNDNGESDLPQPIGAKYVFDGVEDTVTSEDELDLGFVELVQKAANDEKSLILDVYGTQYTPSFSATDIDESGYANNITITCTTEPDPESGESDPVTDIEFTLINDNGIWSLTQTQTIYSDGDACYFYFQSGQSFSSVSEIYDDNETYLGKRLISDGVQEQGNYLDLTLDQMDFVTLEAFYFDENDLTGQVYLENQGAEEGQDGPYVITDGVDSYATISNMGDGESDFNWIISTADGNAHYIGLTITDVPVQ